MALKGKNKPEKEGGSQSERYTIFHALFEALKEKEKKHKKQ
jgi:hypothetical protein